MSTYRERRERKADRLRGWADAREANEYGMRLATVADTRSENLRQIQTEYNELAGSADG